MFGILVRNENVGFIKKSEEVKKPPFDTKTFSFQESLHFHKLKRVFPDLFELIETPSCQLMYVVDSIHLSMLVRYSNSPVTYRQTQIQGRPS